MKNIIVVAIFFSVCTTVFAQTNFSSVDKEQIISNLDALILAVNANDAEAVSSLISPDNHALRHDIQERIRGVVRYQLDYGSFDKNAEIITPNRVRIKARFVASGIGWEISGLSTYFIFEKQQGQWLIADTNFHQKLGVDYVLGIFKKIFIFGGPIFILFILLFAFWLWMLIDCAMRDFNKKTLWIILLAFLNVGAAVLYFFIVRRKNAKKKSLDPQP